MWRVFPFYYFPIFHFWNNHVTRICTSTFTLKLLVLKLFMLKHLIFFYTGNGNVGVVATDRSYLHLALNQPSMTWLKLPFSPLVTAKAANVPKPLSKKWYTRLYPKLYACSTLRTCCIGANRFNLNQFWLIWLRCPKRTLFWLFLPFLVETQLGLGRVITRLSLCNVGLHELRQDGGNSWSCPCSCCFRSYRRPNSIRIQRWWTWRISTAFSRNRVDTCLAYHWICWRCCSQYDCPSHKAFIFCYCWRACNCGFTLKRAYARNFFKIQGFNVLILKSSHFVCWQYFGNFFFTKITQSRAKWWRHTKIDVHW